jgi:hypothetical protein
MGLNLNPVGGIIEAVGKVADDLFTSDDERLKADLAGMAIGLDAAKVDAELIRGQQEINKEEAKHASIFVAGARPAILWVGVVALAYQFVLYPLLTWLWAWLQAMGWVPVGLVPPPMLNNESLMVLITAVLGVSTSRTFEKVRGVSRDSLREPGSRLESK